MLRINGEAVDPKRQYVLAKGDTVLIGTPGGGGHGREAERSNDARRADQLSNYVA